MVLVEYTDPNLRSSYSQHIIKVGIKKGLAGEQDGKWRILENPVGMPVKKSKEPERIIKTEESKPGIDILKLPVSIIILTLNNLRYTRICLESIRTLTRNNYQLVMVDNGSSDGTLQYLSLMLRNDDILIKNARNRGFSAGNNQGLMMADGDYILYLNNDIKVTGENWLTISLKGLISGGYDLAGPTLRKVIPDDNIKQFIFGGDGTTKDPYHYLEGWNLLGKREVLEHLGGFDERYTPAYSEDSDLSIAARRYGYKLGHIPNNQIVHYGNKTSSLMGTGHVQTISAENRKKLYSKWIGSAKKKLCVIRQGAMGDVLLTTPIVRALRRQYPSAVIDYVTQCAQFLQGNPHVNNIFSSGPTTKTYDRVVRLEYEKNPGNIRIDTMAEQAKVTLKSRAMEVFFPSVPPDNTETPYICIHTGKSWPNRMWPGRYWYKLLGELCKRYKIIQVGDGNTEVIRHKGFNFYKTKPWEKVAAILAGARYFVGIDSAPANLAKALNIQCFTLYGCVNPYVMQCDAMDVPLVAQDLDCFGCRDRSTKTYVECVKKEPYCVTSVTPEQVMATITRWEADNEI